MINTVIDGEYRVDALLGKGAFGMVYRCHELRLERTVAIKMLDPATAGEKELRRFLDEGRKLAALSHPNVVQIYRLGSFQDQPYIVMEYLTGRTLRDILQHGRPPLRTGLEIMRQVASGLAAVHSRGIVHRDLSSNNVMIQAGGSVKILDLGLAREIDSLATVSVESFLAGTIPYISPEQIEGRSATPASDLFSVGVMLFQVATGTNPFDAEHFMSVLYNIANRPVPLVSSVVPAAPPALDRLVEHCLEKRPEDRPSSAEAVASALDSILAAGIASGETTTIVAPVPVSRRSSAPANPYLSRTMLKRREDFRGRSQEVKKIYARLNATPPGSVSIVGERKIGKSSLLNYIYMRRNREEYLDHPEKMVMVFLDLQVQHRMTLESFVRSLLGMAEYELRGRLHVADCAASLEGIKDLVQRLDKEGFRLAILLDEFEVITRNENFDLEFFSFLRYLANHYNVAYLTSSGRDLQILCHTKEIRDSPFFNIFSRLSLGVFRPEEAVELIRVPSAEIGCPLFDHRERILELAGLFPFFIQIACSHAVEYLQENPEAVAPDFAEVGRRFYEEAQLHYRYIWDHEFDVDERSAIVRVARGRPTPDALRHVIEALSRRSYVVQEGSRARLFSSSFQEFVTRTERSAERSSFLRRLLRPRSR